MRRQRGLQIREEGHLKQDESPQERDRRTARIRTRITRAMPSATRSGVRRRNPRGRRSRLAFLFRRVVGVGVPSLGVSSRVRSFTPSAHFAQYCLLPRSVTACASRWSGAHKCGCWPRSACGSSLPGFLGAGAGAPAPARRDVGIRLALGRGTKLRSAEPPTEALTLDRNGIGLVPDGRAFAPVFTRRVHRGGQYSIGPGRGKTGPPGSLS